MLLAFGSGVIKPNISTPMGLTYDQQRPGQAKLRSDAFYMFYFAINLGSVASTYLLPLVANPEGPFGSRGYRIAFLITAGLMAASLAFFASR